MAYFRRLKTSDRISTIFVLFNFFALIILLLSINVVYFVIWYEDQKEMSHFDVNINYQNLVKTSSFSNMEAFKEYIMGKDTIILSDDGELDCSDGVSEKIHNDQEALKALNDSYFFKYDNKIYFIFSEYYEDIGHVKILFDTTEYIKSQIMIVKISLIIIAIFGLLSYFIGRTFSKYALRDLKKISEDAQNINIDNFKKIEVEGPECDEIKILADTINASFEKIKCQTGSLKQFITDVSHEFKTPLMIINSKIDLYHKMEEKGKASKQDRAELLEGIKLNTKKLNKLLETLFLLSRKSEGIEKFEREEVNMTEYLKSYASEFVHNVDNGVEFSFVGEAKVEKSVDISTLNIVLENLLTNAIKFNKKTPHVEVGIDTDHFWVKDSGPGIAKDDLDKIWTKFYRKDVNIEGFGVGLFIVKRILNLYGWKVEVESELGIGTIFKIYF